MYTEATAIRVLFNSSGLSIENILADREVQEKSRAGFAISDKILALESVEKNFTVLDNWLQEFDIKISKVLRSRSDITLRAIYEGRLDHGFECIEISHFDFVKNIGKEGLQMPT